MKQILLCIFCTIQPFSGIFAQVYSLLGTTGDDISQSGTQLADGSIVAFGNTKNSVGQQDAYIIKMNTRGDVLKRITYGGTGTETGTSVCATYDKGYAITGSTNSAGVAGGKDLFVAKFSSADVPEWVFAYGGSGDDEAAEIIQTSDSGFLVVGSNRSFGHNTLNVQIIKLTSNGAIEWSKSLFSNASDYGMRGIELGNYYYITSAVNVSSVIGKGDVFITKLNKQGDIIWNRVMGQTDNDQVWKMVPTLDGKLAFTFASVTPSQTAKELVFAKIDTAGNLIFSTLVQNGGKGIDGFDIVQLSDSSFVIPGHAQDLSGNDWRGIVLRFNKNGTLGNNWRNTQTQEATFWKINRTNHMNGYCIFGYGKLLTSNNYDFFVLLTDSTLTAGCKNWINLNASSKTFTPTLQWANNFFGVSEQMNRNTLSWTTSNDQSTLVRTDLNFHNPLQTSLPETMDFCTVDSATLDPGPRQWYQWENSNNYNRIFYATDYGLYRLKFYTNYCYGFDSVLLVKSTFQPELLTSADTCGYESMLIGSATNSRWKYLWNTNETNASILIQNSGTYSIVVTDTVKNCVYYDTLAVNLNGITTAITVDSMDVCLKSNLFRLKATPTFSLPNDRQTEVQWRYKNQPVNDSSLLEHSFSDTGKHLLYAVVLSEKGCKSIDSIVLHVQPHPIAMFDISDTSLCLDSNIFYLSSRSYSHNTPISLQWDMGNNTIVNDSVHFSYTYNTYGSFNIRLMATSAFHCSHDTNVLVAVKPTPIALLSFNTPLEQCFKNHLFGCTNNSYTPDFSTIAKLNLYLGNDSIVHNFSTHNFSYDKPGKYVVRLQVESAFGCKTDTETELTVLPTPQPVLDVITTDSCHRNNAFTFLNNTTADTLTLSSFLHTGDMSVYANPTLINHHYADTGTFTALLAIENIFGCTDTVMKNITVYRSPTTLIEMLDSQFCFKNNRFVWQQHPSKLNAADQYQWFLPNRTDTGYRLQHQFTDYGPQKVVLLAKTTHNCLDSAQKTIHILPSPTAHFQLKELCLGDTLFLENNSHIPLGFIDSAAWFIEQNNIANTMQAKFMFDEAGSYPVGLIVKADNGCKDTLFQQAVVRPNPVAAFEWIQNKKSYLGDEWKTASLTADAINHTWHFSDSTVFYTPEVSKIFSDTLTLYTRYIAENQYGCKDTAYDTRFFTVNKGLFVPDAFSPNDDGFNDYFIPVGINKDYSYEMVILNRWGETVFHTNNPDIYWDGTLNEIPVPQGVYVYLLLIDNGTFVMKGTLHLLR